MDAKEFVQNIKLLCDRKGVKPTVACKESGAGKDLINQIERRGSMPSIEKVQLLADYLGVTTSELLGEVSGGSSSGIHIPVLGTIPAGIPLDAIEDILDWEEIPAAWSSGNRQYFGLRVKGDSMYPRYLEGDTVILQKEKTCESGDDCAVLVNGGEATLKQVMIRGDGSLELRPTNPVYPPRIYSPAEIESLPVQIIGVVVELRRKIK
ncbi:helix-turn-helix domain-containing protein [Pseudoflavonifractor phocaeensis]|nr:XRE family transcriptional regulator [Pseudoflavonifractor phocaeensis]MBM6926933.1 helix-turn-helix domain-containing protein [Pseudoflavonifractor phocaeensis]